ncbi:unnamed protein product [Arctogadus glacialis]
MVNMMRTFVFLSGLCLYPPAFMSEPFMVYRKGSSTNDLYLALSHVTTHRGRGKRLGNGTTCIGLVCFGRTPRCFTHTTTTTNSTSNGLALST